VSTIASMAAGIDQTLFRVRTVSSARTRGHGIEFIVVNGGRRGGDDRAMRKT
jgi:hypothetical protein